MKKSRIRKKSALKSLFGLFSAGSLALFSTVAVAGALSLVYAALEMPDSSVAKWLVRLLAIASVGSVGSAGGLPTGVRYLYVRDEPGACGSQADEARHESCPADLLFDPHGLHEPCR